MPTLDMDAKPVVAEKIFSKYDKRGAYHWDYLSNNPRKHNSFDKARYDLVVALADPKGQRVLDVGCGDGVLSYLLAKKGGIVTGVDPSELAIAAARQKMTGYPALSANFVAGSAYEMPFEDESFDAVVCSEVIEHVAQPDRLVAEMNRVLRKGGRLIITTPYRSTEVPFDPEHVQEFFPQQLKALTSGYFPDASIRLSHPWFYFELYHKKFFGKRLGMWALNLLSIAGFNPFLTQSPFKLYAIIVLQAAKPQK